MIDNLVLSIPWGQYEIIRPEYFHPTAERLTRNYSNGCSWTKFIQNASKNDKLSGNYLPGLTIKDTAYAFRKTPLFIDLNVPKLLYGNNLAEAKPEDLKEAISSLGLKLFQQMGIKVASHILETAEIINAHFCRNIYLTGGYTAQGVIRQLNKLNYSKKLDHNTRQFENDGLAFYLFCKHLQIIFYDKIADLNKQTRSIDYHHNDYQQLNFFEKKPEVLRLEIRLTHKSKLISLLKRLGYTINPAPFSFFFSQELANKVLQNYWSKLYSPEANVLFQPSKPADILETLLIKGYKVQKALQTAMLVATAQESGIRMLRSIIEAKTSIRQWYRVEETLKIALKVLKNNKPVQFIDDIEKAIGLDD